MGVIWCVVGVFWCVVGVANQCSSSTWWVWLSVATVVYILVTNVVLSLFSLSFLHPPLNRVELLPGASHSVQVIRSFLGRESTTTDGKALWNKLSSSINVLSPSDMNYALYRCDNEEKDDGRGGGVYVVPGAGAMVYCGLQVNKTLV